MKRIPLTQGREALVDDIDYDYLIQFKWYALWMRNGYRAKRNSPRVNGKQKAIYIHTVIAGRMGIDSRMIDHKDRNPLNNQRKNLRLATKVKNGRNRGLIENSKSGYKGVSWDTNNVKWRARIQVNGKQTHLGLFDDKVEAAKAYNAAAKKHFGEFAWLNPIPGED